MLYINNEDVKNMTDLNRLEEKISELSNCSCEDSTSKVKKLKDEIHMIKMRIFNEGLEKKYIEHGKKYEECIQFRNNSDMQNPSNKLKLEELNKEELILRKKRYYYVALNTSCIGKSMEEKKIICKKLDDRMGFGKDGADIIERKKELFDNQICILRKIFTGLYKSFEEDRKAGIGVFEILPLLKNISTEVFLAPEGCKRDLDYIYEKGTIKK